MSDKLVWRTEKRRVKELVPYEFNPRILTEKKKEKLKESLEKFNLAEIPAINTDNTIIAGHQRIKVLMMLERGEEEIDVRVPCRELTELEMKEYNITSNVPAGFWDLEVLDEAFADIDLEGLGLDLSEFNIPDFIGEDLGLDPEEEGEVDLELPIDPVSKRGDVYRLVSRKKKTQHVLVVDDALEMQSLAKAMDGHDIDLLLTDPPYNVNYEGGTAQKLKIENDSMTDQEFYDFMFKFYQSVFDLMPEGAPFYIFHADSEWFAFRYPLREVGFKLAQSLVWKKNQLVMGRQDYQWIHEPILYGWKPGSKHHWYGGRKLTTVIEVDKPKRNGEHPTMKPLDLIAHLVKASSTYKNHVLDPFGGSGSTLITCERELRNAHLCELDPRYGDVIVRRWVKYMKDNGLEFEVYRNDQKLEEESINEFEADPKEAT